MKKTLRYSFWLSILLHLLLLASFILVYIWQPDVKKPPHDYVPSYVYKGAITPTVTQFSSKSVKSEQKTAKVSPKLRVQKDLPVSKQGIQPYSMLATSLTTLQQSQFKQIAKPKETEPILLIGDKNEVADPLIKLLGRSLSAHFTYPETEGRLGIRGRVIIEMTLHPQGTLSDIQLVKSSENRNLDAAALYATNTAPIIEGADRFIDKPKHFVIGFVFY